MSNVCHAGYPAHASLLKHIPATQCRISPFDYLAVSDALQHRVWWTAPFNGLRQNVGLFQQQRRLQLRRAAARAHLKLPHKCPHITAECVNRAVTSLHLSSSKRSRVSRPKATGDRLRRKKRRDSWAQRRTGRRLSLL